MKTGLMYWTPVSIAVPDDDRQVLLCKQAQNGNITYSLGYYDGERFVTMGCAKVTHWIDFPNVRSHTAHHWRSLKREASTGYIWKDMEGGDDGQ